MLPLGVDLGNPAKEKHPFGRRTPWLDEHTNDMDRLPLTAEYGNCIAARESVDTLPVGGEGVNSERRGAPLGAPRRCVATGSDPEPVAIEMRNGPRLPEDAEKGDVEPKGFSSMPDHSLLEFASALPPHGAGNLLDLKCAFTPPRGAGDRRKLTFNARPVAGECQWDERVVGGYG
ncbi:MAG: hypothetical protein NVS4B3_01750 [Gemmatimonadaceae bacterium]